jgi:hypothetical protein
MIFRNIKVFVYPRPLKKIAYNPLYSFLIKTTYKVFLFNLVQFSFIIENPRQRILEKRTRYVHLERYTPKKRYSSKLFRESCSCVTKIVAVLPKSKQK